MHAWNRTWCATIGLTFVWVITEWFHVPLFSSETVQFRICYIYLPKIKRKWKRDLLVLVSWRWYSIFGLFGWLRIKGLHKDVALYQSSITRSAALNAADLRTDVLRKDDSLSIVKVATSFPYRALIYPYNFGWENCLDMNITIFALKVREKIWRELVKWILSYRLNSWSLVDSGAKLQQ